MKKSKTLGAVKMTPRGFEYIEFKDRNGCPCSLQASSLAEYTIPGTSAVWFGQITNRMHLDRRQVAALIQALNLWLDTGSFAPKRPK